MANLSISYICSNKMSDEIIQFNKSKCLELVCGAVGIYVTYLAVGLMQEWLIKYPYKNTETN